MKPVLESLAEKNKDRMDYQQIDVDMYPELAVKYGVTSIPAMFMVPGLDGQPTMSIVGGRSKAVLEASIEAELNKLEQK